MHHVAGFDQGLLVFVHEAGPAFDHDHDLEIRLMPVPSGARFWCHIGLDQVRNHFSVRGFSDTQVAVQKKVPQSAWHKLRVGGLYVGKLGGSAVEHGVLLKIIKPRSKCCSAAPSRNCSSHHPVRDCHLTSAT